MLELGVELALTSINWGTQEVVHTLLEILVMWQKYKLSKHKKKPHHLPLLAYEEREFEKKRYFKIRCRHFDRVISEWVAEEAFKKLSPQLCYLLRQQQSLRIQQPPYSILDFHIKGD